MNVYGYTFEQFYELARNFHGYPAPGLLLGGYMVELARQHLPEGTLFEVLSETPKCLPDAVQLLTPCTFGNNRLRNVNLGRYAVVFYDKFTGEGVRVFLDAAKVEAWPEIAGWLFKRTPKKEQNTEKLLAEIREAGVSCCSVQQVRVPKRMLGKKSMGDIVICPSCGEAYPAMDGAICRGCLGEAPYALCAETAEEQARPELCAVLAEDAVGKTALHDMTRVVPGREKGPAFLAGQSISGGDVCRLHQMGRMRVYTEEDSNPGENWVHENTAVEALARRMAGDGVAWSTPPKEGKINFYPEHNGLFVVNRRALRAFNMVPDVMCATRRGDTYVEKGKTVAGARAIPLYIAKDRLRQALETLDEPLLEVLPLKAIPVGVLVTGTEVALGLIEDRFAPTIETKLQPFACPLAGVEIAPDETRAIAEATRRLLSAGAGLIVTTAGLSVDPDDVTLQGLREAGLDNALRGMPVLPGATALLGDVNGVPVMGVPACALFHKTTVFDLLLPRVLAGQQLTRADLAAYAEGGLCWNCNVCTFPKCPFGK